MTTTTARTYHEATCPHCAARIVIRRKADPADEPATVVCKCRNRIAVVWSPDGVEFTRMEDPARDGKQKAKAT